ncbi:hypothetical protein [Protofrankia symbiont of Coriaria ruscifolia]|uniref:hypothetical protein n=1 Tax=Protofrankia symbiont of Coriaria ruscifolia TaxID=1306542 RepID=UPI0010416F9D|nr:hypothetical protein [Protofrankia symbiont of Coriaria ruscifolia]
MNSDAGTGGRDVDALLDHAWSDVETTDLSNATDPWETWFTAVRTALTREAVTTRTHGRTNNTTRLVHTQCHRRHPDGAAKGTDT